MLDTHYGSFMSPSVPNGRDNRSKAPGESQGPFGMPNSFFGGAMPPSDKPRNPDWFKKREERLNPTINENGYLVKYVRENLNKFFQTEFPQLIREAIQAQNSQYQPQTPEQQPQPQQQAAAVPSQRDRRLKPWFTQDEWLNNPEIQREWNPAGFKGGHWAFPFMAYNASQQRLQSR